MKSIILKPHELQNIDRLTCVVRPMKEPQGWTTKLIDGDHKPWPAKPVYDKRQKCLVTGLVDPPFSQGETVFVKEAWRYPWQCDCPECRKQQRVYYRSDADIDLIRWQSAQSMPSWASRYHIMINGVEAKVCSKFDVDSIKSLGSPNMCFASDYYKWFENMYKITDASLLWLFKVEVKRVN